MIRLTIGLLFGAALALPAQAQSIQGKWQYLLKTTDGINTGILDIDANGQARAAARVTGIGYTESGAATLHDSTVDVQFTEAQAPGTGLTYSPDHFVCHFSSANLLDCTMSDQRGGAQGRGQLARSGTQEASTLGQKPVAVQGSYYTDRRTGCRLWTPYFHQDATVQWSGGCQGGLAEGPEAER